MSSDSGVSTSPGPARWCLVPPVCTSRRSAPGYRGPAAVVVSYEFDAQTEATESPFQPGFLRFELPPGTP